VGDYREAEDYSSNAISLPLYPSLQEDDQQRVVDVLALLLK
jgi:dTDP-4-amino-4,6-dideoxygalactose transaminase